MFKKKNLLINTFNWTWDEQKGWCRSSIRRIQMIWNYYPVYSSSQYSPSSYHNTTGKCFIVSKNKNVEKKHKKKRVRFVYKLINPCVCACVWNFSRRIFLISTKTHDFLFSSVRKQSWKIFVFIWNENCFSLSWTRNFVGNGLKRRAVFFVVGFVIIFFNLNFHDYF